MINDPQVARAHTIEGIGISQAGIIENKPVYVDPYEETGQKAYHITYILNGGENSISNREVYHEKELPVTLDVPVKEGYNFCRMVYRQQLYKEGDRDHKEKSF